MNADFQGNKKLMEDWHNTLLWFGLKQSLENNPKLTHKVSFLDYFMYTKDDKKT